MTRARTLWEEGTEPGRLVVALGAAVTLTVTVLDLLVSRELTWLFDTTFVLLCLALALLVRPADFFTVGVLPPLLMLGTFLLLGLLTPALVADEGDGTVQAVITGLAHHSGALTAGYLLCLGCLAMRHRVLTQRRQGGSRPGQPSNRAGLPAPRRTTVGTPSE